MDTFAQRKYVEARREGHGAQTALRMARWDQTIREMWMEGYTGGEVLTWEDEGNACTVGLSWQYDGGYDPREDDWAPDAYPVAERAAVNRKRGMARGPAWLEAERAYREDVDNWEREGWATIIVTVEAEDYATGAMGSSVLGTTVTPDEAPDDAAIDCMLNNYMREEAIYEMRKEAHTVTMRTLPPMLRRPWMDAA